MEASGCTCGPGLRVCVGPEAAECGREAQGVRGGPGAERPPALRGLVWSCGISSPPSPPLPVDAPGLDAPGPHARVRVSRGVAACMGRTGGAASPARGSAWRWPPFCLLTHLALAAPQDDDDAEDGSTEGEGVGQEEGAGEPGQAAVLPDYDFQANQVGVGRSPPPQHGLWSLSVPCGVEKGCPAWHPPPGVGRAPRLLFTAHRGCPAGCRTARPGHGRHRTLMSRSSSFQTRRRNMRPKSIGRR